MIAVETSGPLFEGRLDVRRGQRLGLERATGRAAELARAELRRHTRYSTEKYGHAAESVRTRIATVTGDQQQGVAYIGGRSAYLAPWLEFGIAPFDIPGGRGRIRPGRRRRRIRGIVTLAIPGIGLRSYRRDKPFKHRGTPAYRWRSISQAAINREAQGIFEQAMAEALTP